MLSEIDPEEAAAREGGCDEARRSYRAAARRDPRRFPFGYLAADAGTGAVGPFVWFATVAELVEFLATTEVDVLALDAGEAESIARWVRRTAGATREVARLDRDALSASFLGWTEVVWLGTFADLCERGGPFQTAVRAAFRAEHGLGEHAGPIADDERDAFVAYLALGAAAL